jgi:hypothetical protein
MGRPRYDPGTEDDIFITLAFQPMPSSPPSPDTLIMERD